MASEKIQGILDFIGALSVKEFIELHAALQEQWGVVPTTSCMRLLDEQFVCIIDDYLIYNIVLKEIGPQKIQVLKLVREASPSLGLKEAKELVESAPVKVAEAYNREDAIGIKKKLEAVGAAVEVTEITSESESIILN